MAGLCNKNKSGTMHEIRKLEVCLPAQTAHEKAS
jgi:hypothetical protein